MDGTASTVTTTTTSTIADNDTNTTRIRLRHDSEMAIQYNQTLQRASKASFWGGWYWGLWRSQVKAASNGGSFD